MAWTIVVIDDEPELCAFVKELLEFSGYEVIGVAVPGELHRDIGTMEPNLFLIDIMLPGISGIELAEQLRTSRYADVPMIAMSASKLMSHMASSSGVFDEAIDKPFEIDHLLGSIERHLEGHMAGSC